jgi:glycosyltransferase involved in cell wall biosynthesis
MLNGYSIAVIIPCYNVEGSIRRTIERMPDCVDRIIAVEDASTDGTRQALAALGDARLIVLHHDRNQGVGGAMATGFAHALDLDVDLVVKLDGDGQMDPALIPALAGPITDDVCDYAKGNRFLHTRELRRMPVSRKFGNVVLTFLTKLASGYWHVFDPQNGFLAIHKEYLELLDLDRLREAGYFFENEMLIQLNVMAARVLDYPMPAHYAGAQSSLRIANVLFSFPPRLVRGFLSRTYQRYVLRDFNMIVPLYIFGGALFSFGCLFGGYTWWYYAIKVQASAPTGTIMLSVLPLILGFQMLIQGLLIDILESPRAEGGRRKGGEMKAE